MKTFRILIAAAICALIVGCVMKNPAYQPLPADQNPVSNPQYIAQQDTISNTAAIAHQVNATTAPLNPFSAPTGWAIDGVAALVAAASLLVAKLKSNQAAKSKALVTTIATGVVQAGPTAIAAVQNVASSTEHFAQVAEAINDATP